MWTDGRYYL